MRLLLPPRTGTLARVAMTGGALLYPLHDVVAAGTRDAERQRFLLAILRRDWIEFPGRGQRFTVRIEFTYVRIAPDGQKLALADAQNIVVLTAPGIRRRCLRDGET